MIKFISETEHCSIPIPSLTTRRLVASDAQLLRHDRWSSEWAIPRLGEDEHRSHPRYNLRRCPARACRMM